MFAKIFNSIFESSIADDWKTRIVFQDFLVLADADGVVDMTPTAIARRTNIPIEIVQEAIPKLEAPDTASRTPDHEGRRILRLEAHREWGWRIVNYTKYRESATKEMLRMAEADRKRAYRAKFHRKSNSPTPHKNTDTDKEERESSPVTSPGLSGTCPPTLSNTDRQILNAELQEIRKQLREAGNLKDYETGGRRHREIQGIMNRRIELQSILGVRA